ncbi:DUF4276 family protein [Gordonia sp. NB41Y]|uniref:DUF4276 family protein n=1 Tax=Gordonia sp. NB41Y TaxID=875808 RepID=UPI001C9E1678|nr:DUF4276 family protein [Gordonia sp. NB41Y]WLP92135.1 DUF4276 family protein [Gordonia sp. NB41Y]
MVNVAVEGESDREAAKAVIKCVGHQVGKVVVAGGKTKLDPKIPGYCAAARNDNWVVFRDSDGKCPVELRATLGDALPTPPNSRFALRIAHSMTEAWLLADTVGFSEFFHVKASQIPREPEKLAHAKQTVLDLCRNSRSRGIRGDLVAAGTKTGPLYVPRINEFAGTRWDVRAAAERSPSLARALIAIADLPR